MKKHLVFITILFYSVIQSQEIEFNVFNTSINSKYAELGTKYFGPSKLIFATSKKNENDGAFKKNRRKNNRQLFLDLYVGVITKNGDIIQSNKFYNETDNKFFESDVAFTSDLKTVYFTWNNYYNVDNRRDSTNWKTLRIVKANIDENFQIHNVHQLPINSDKFSNKNPVLNKDETKLFFVSNRDTKKGETDIYVVDILKNNTYGVPKKLNAKINSEASEIFPFIDENNTLYFASNGHKGFGGFDIFKVNLNNELSEIEPLPTPINSSFDDFAFIVNNTSKSGFFTSNRPQSKGDVDIYAFNYNELEIEIEEPPCEQLITGTIIDSESNKLLNNIQVFLYNDSQIVEAIELNNSEEFSFKLECEKNYKIVAKKNGYLPNEIEFSTNNTNLTNLKKQLLLTPIKCRNIVSGKILNSKTNLPLSNAIVSLFKNDSLISNIPINNSAEFKVQIDCESNYKLSAKLNNFKKDSVLLVTTKENHKIFYKILRLKEIEKVEKDIEFVTVRKQKMVKTNPIYFDLDKSNIRPDAAIELSKVVDVLKKYPTIKIEVKAHTDSRAPDSYNYKLSNSRAKSTIDYIISQGIDSERIFGKGYGETQLINKCSNGVKCTETEHQLNRRTEFIVIDKE
ncbi:OmpA family protein [Lutibacter sp. TH_r2]|uniref:OmpA family protein n=1 Tax=Lutibacter sp. TH_r2 TaxID=3082083 RepID=UPI00295335F5|nr:OmpA family protein [Lutibacter sp. TH_r2]MDV7187382.1 OmpA family protein [Lutibacter sp. TH_r2]